MKNIPIKWLFLLVLSIIWGSSFILIKKGLLGLTAIQLGALRNVFTGIILLIIGASTLKTIEKKSWKWLLISGLLGSFFPSFLFAIAETEIDSAVASILNSLVPLNTILLGFAVFKIGSTRRQLLGVIVGFIGTAILILTGADLNPEQNYWYASFVLLSTLMYACNINIIKRYLQNEKPLAIAAGNYVFITIPALIILIFTEFFDLSNFEEKVFNQSIIYVFILSLFGTAIAKIIFNKLVQISSPVFASSVTYLMTIVALLWGLLDGESFGVVQLLAAIMVLIGVYLGNRK